MKSKVATWRPEEPYERPGFSDEDLQAIEDTLPRPFAHPRWKEVLWNGLNDVVAAYRWDIGWDQAPPAARSIFLSISAAANARKLLRQLGVEDEVDWESDPIQAIPYAIQIPLRNAAEIYGMAIGGYQDHPPTESTIKDAKPDYHGSEKLNDTLRSLQLFLAWCDLVREHRRSIAKKSPLRIEQHLGQTDHRRHRGNEALNAMIARLAKLYVKVLDRKPGIARSRSGQGRPGGPFVRFVVTFCNRADIKLTATGLEKRWRKVRSSLHTPDQDNNNPDPSNSPQKKPSE
jgi:hypothetical protein